MAVLIPIHVDLNHRKIGFLIYADHLGIVTGAAGRFVLQLYANAVRLIHDVPVGDNVPLGIDTDAGT